jgi:parvulin-like peptidyl-prolyl isomerase
MPNDQLPIEIPPGRPWLSVDETNRLMRQQGLVLAVAQAWLLDEVARSVTLPEAELPGLVTSYLHSEGVEDEATRQAFLRRKGWAEEDLAYFATKARRLEVFQESCFADEVELRFLERKLDLDQVTYSLLRLEEQELAEELHQQILEGEADFPELARRYSSGPERYSHGQVGPLPLSAGHEELVQRLRAGVPGQVWPPFHLVNIWVVLRFEQLFPAKLDADMRARLLEEIFDLWLDARVQLLLAAEPLPPLPLHKLEAP